MNRPPATKNFFYNTIDQNDGNFCLCSDICYHYFLIRVIFCLYNFIQKVEIFPCLIIAGCIAEHSERSNNFCQVVERRANQHSTDDMHSKLEMFLESATKNRVCKLTTIMSLARKYISLSGICILTSHWHQCLPILCYAQQYLLQTRNFDVLKNISRIQVASFLLKVKSCYR